MKCRVPLRVKRSGALSPSEEFPLVSVSAVVETSESVFPLWVDLFCFLSQSLLNLGKYSTESESLLRIDDRSSFQFVFSPDSVTSWLKCHVLCWAILTFTEEPSAPPPALPC